MQVNLSYLALVGPVVLIVAAFQRHVGIFHSASRAGKRLKLGDDSEIGITRVCSPSKSKLEKRNQGGKRITDESEPATTSINAYFLEN